MKTNTSHSAPLTPLAPPAGITGTMLPASPVKDTPAGVVHPARTLPKADSYVLKGGKGWEFVSTQSNITNGKLSGTTNHRVRVEKAAGGWKVSTSSKGDPETVVNDMPTLLYFVGMRSAHAHDYIAACFKLAAHVIGQYAAPASPVASVGVPAPDSAPLMDGRENLQGVTFVSKNHAGKTPWTVEHYHRNGEWVCRESQYGTTMNFHEREIKAWRKAPPVDGFKLQSMRLREERSRIIVMEDGSMLVANTEDEAEAIVEACASHAAKDAKIKALTEALTDLLDDPRGNALSRKNRNAGNAALALPCA